MIINSLLFWAKCKRLIFCIITLITVFISSAASAQNSKIGAQSSFIKIKSKQWKSLIINESVDINYKYAECNMPSQGTDNEYYYLQVINKTNKSLQVEWNQEYWYNEKCTGCESGNQENIKKIKLQPKEIKEGTCSEKSIPELKIFSKMLSFKIKSELSDFNIRNVKVTPLNN